MGSVNFARTSATFKYHHGYIRLNLITLIFIT